MFLKESICNLVNFFNLIYVILNILHMLCILCLQNFDVLLTFHMIFNLFIKQQLKNVLIIVFLEYLF